MHVTVAIPTKNERHTIARTLDMLNDQTRTPDLVLLADDSDDDTAYFSRVTAFKHDYEITTFTPDHPGIGAAREALRRRAPTGLLLCLDAEVCIEPDWLEEHITIHESHDQPAVVSGTWPGSEIGGTEVLTDAKHPAYYIEANCSMPTQIAEKLGGWDAEFRRGCDWDFRIRLADTPDVNAIASDRVGAAPMDSNNGSWLHIKKQFARPSSIPYLRKYGPGYAAFHPKHIAGDILGVSALTALMATPLYPIALTWVGVCMAAYAWHFDPPGFSFTDRLAASPAVFALGGTALKAVVRQ